MGGIASEPMAGGESTGGDNASIPMGRIVDGCANVVDEKIPKTKKFNNKYRDEICIKTF